MNELALFAGAGGGILAGHLLGWRTVCAVEVEPYAAHVLVARQNDGLLPLFPVWDDVRSFDGRPWRGIVDVVSGGFPCQDISIAGKGAGIAGQRSGLWAEFARIVGEVRPRFVYVENSPMLVSRGLGTVVGDLAAMGYDCRWGVVSAADAGAQHTRERIWIVAYANGERELQPEGGEQDQRRRAGDGGSETLVPDAIGREREVEWHPSGVGRLVELGPQREPDFGSIAVEPELGRVADEVAHRMDRLRCLGNGQVPQCAAYAWRLLTGAV